MIKKIGQLVSYQAPGFNLWNEIEAQEQCKIKSITRLGVQAPVNSCIYINGEAVYMGALERIEFADADIVSPIIVNNVKNDVNNESSVYVILDYEYIEEKKGV